MDICTAPEGWLGDPPRWRLRQVNYLRALVLHPCPVVDLLARRRSPARQGGKTG
jgi:hypothetical protein